MIRNVFNSNPRRLVEVAFLVPNCYSIFMKPTRRQILLVVWIVCVIGSGLLIGNETESFKLGLATSFAVLGVSLGVPLMRAFTEFSK